MANKYNKGPYTPHHPHNVSIGVETEYVEIANEGAKGPRMHTQAYKHEQRPRNQETPNACKVQEDGDEVKEKHGMKPRPPPHPHNMHTLCLEGMHKV